MAARVTGISGPMPTSTQVIPFLKWAGGKRWLAPQIVGEIGAISGRYIEPFLGGGAVFFTVQPERALLGDLNGNLVEAYRTIKRAWRKVVEILEDHQIHHSKDHYYQVREWHPDNPLERTARMIYLNRTCWNGLYRVNLDGKFNVPIGTKTCVLMDTDDFQTTARLLRNADIVCGDFEGLIDQARRGDVVFADPPYTVRHKYNGFIKYNESLFSWNDQIRLRDAVLRASERGARIFVTNADHESIRTLYASDFEIRAIERYSAISGRSSSRGNYSELIITR